MLRFGGTKFENYFVYKFQNEHLQNFNHRWLASKSFFYILIERYAANRSGLYNKSIAIQAIKWSFIVFIRSMINKLKEGYGTD